MATHASTARISTSPRCSPPSEKNRIFGSSLALKFPGSSAPGEALPTVPGPLGLGEHRQPAPFQASFRQLPLLCPAQNYYQQASDSTSLPAIKILPQARTELFNRATSARAQDQHFVPSLQPSDTIKRFKGLCWVV